MKQDPTVPPAGRRGLVGPRRDPWRPMGLPLGRRGVRRDQTGHRRLAGGTVGPHLIVPALGLLLGPHSYLLKQRPMYFHQSSGILHRSPCWSEGFTHEVDCIPRKSQISTVPSQVTPKFSFIDSSLLSFASITSTYGKFSFVASPGSLAPISPCTPRCNFCLRILKARVDPKSG